MTDPTTIRRLLELAPSRFRLSPPILKENGRREQWVVLRADDGTEWALTDLRLPVE